MTEDNRKKMPFADFIDDCLPVVVKNDDEQLIQ